MSVAELDKMPAEAMSEKQLQKYITYLRDQLDKERKERPVFQLDCEKIQSFLELCRQNLENTKAELSCTDAASWEAGKHHQMEVGAYKMHLRHELHELHNAISDLKSDLAAHASIIQSYHSKSELELWSSFQRMHTDHRHEKHMKNLSIEEINLKHWLELRGLTSDYEERIRDVEFTNCRRYHQNVILGEEKHQELMNNLDNKWKNRTRDLMQKHKTILRDAAETIFSLQTDALVQERAFKRKAADMQKLLSQADKDFVAAQDHNRCLHESMQEAEQKQSELQQQMQFYNQASACHEKNRAHMKHLESELRDLAVNHELALQEFEKLDKECTKMLKEHRDIIFNLQQEGALKQKILQKKLVLLTPTESGKEAKFNIVSCTTDENIGSSTTIGHQ